MDLLDHLLADPHADARGALRHTLVQTDLNRDVDLVSFNLFEVALDFEAEEARVFDVLNGKADPTVVTFDELRSRLG